MLFWGVVFRVFLHKKIIDALESGDSDFAERAIAEHLKAAAIAIATPRKKAEERWNRRQDFKNDFWHV